MSSFNFKAKEKRTGKIYVIWALDDFFGPHKYGYSLHSQIVGNKDVMNEKDFCDRFEA